MADAPETKTSSFGFLTRKIGPVPIWLIAVVAVGGYYWYTHYGPGAKPAASAAAPSPQIIEVTGPRGARGPAGARGKAGRDDTDRTNREDARVPVPDVVGQKYPQASRRITSAGLTAQRSAPYVGTVRSETPHAGSRVEKGTVVTLRGKPWPPVRGPEPVPVPPVRAAAPMTASDVYGSAPTATMAGGTYDSGDVSTLGGAYAPAG